MLLAFKSLVFFWALNVSSFKQRNDKIDKMASSITVKTGQAYPEDRVNEASIWKMNPLVVSATSLKFKSVFLHTRNE